MQAPGQAAGGRGPEDVEVLEQLEDQADAEQARATLTAWLGRMLALGLAGRGARGARPIAR